jgi:hypothetical protein
MKQEMLDGDGRTILAEIEVELEKEEGEINVDRQRESSS